MPEEIKIGLEVHVELNTKSKLFCGCARKEADANSLCCPICLGMPGAKPVPNKEAINKILKICKALKCKIAKELVFSRKHYFYPDMSKNYQISQYKEALGYDGEIVLKNNKKIKIKRVHLEEDPASIKYPKNMFNSEYSLIDYNRSGRPLAEIVTEPCIRSAKEAREFMNTLQDILKTISVFDKSCTMKADVNISIKESNFLRVEVKNISSFKEIEKAILYEAIRQKNALRFNKLKKETRIWDPISKTTKSSREKESEADYAYIFEANIPRIKIKDLPEIEELPFEKAKRYKAIGINEKDAEIIARKKELSEFFEKGKEYCDAIKLAKWIRKELLRVLNYNKIELYESKIDAENFAKLVAKEGKEISKAEARKLLEKMVKEKIDVNKIKKKEIDIKQIVKEVIKKEKDACEKYKKGNKKVLHYLLGCVMKSNKSIDAKKAIEILKEELDY